MTSAFDVFQPQLPAPHVKANWLGRYLGVENSFDKTLFDTLKEVEKGIAEAFKKVEGAENISRAVRSTQLQLARKTVRQYVDDLFGNKFGNMLRGYRSDAAEAAVDAALYDQRGLLARLFSNPIDRQNYADSLRQTARRNIESTITRVLFTEQPLSQRVWNTKALSNGLINTAVNNGLARGDSAADIARAVRGLVRPDTPGGISYAAKRLGRTEINNAFHAQSILDTQEKPWIAQMEWHLSKRHKTDPGDLCEDYALVGKFNKERVPVKPHPQCRCFVIPVLPDYDTFETHLVQGHYDTYIDRVLSGETYHVGGPTPGPDLSIMQPTQQYTGGKSAAAKRRKAYLESARKAKEKRLGLPPEPEPKKLELIEFDIDDNALTVSQKLEAKYPGVRVGLNDYPTEKGIAREIGRAVDELLQKYPASGLKEIRTGVTWDPINSIAEADPSSMRITFNKYFTSSQDRLHAYDPNHFHPPGFEDRPYYQSTIHEFGHILDYKGQMHARKKVVEFMNDEFFATREWSDIPVTPDWTAIRKDKLKEWLKNNAPSGYSIEGDGLSLRAQEVLPEAFADVVMNGDKAKPMSKQLYKMLIEQAYGKKWYATHAIH